MHNDAASVERSNLQQGIIIPQDAVVVLNAANVPALEDVLVNLLQDHQYLPAKLQCWHR